MSSQIILSQNIPQYFLNEQVKNFTGLKISNPQSNGEGNLTTLDWANGEKEVIYRAPNKGRLIGSKSRLVIDLTPTASDAATDVKPFNHATSLIWNKYYKINGKGVANNISNYGFLHSILSNIHYETEYISGSSGYKTGVNQSSMTTGATLRVYLYLSNPKYRNFEDLLKNSFDLDSVETFEVVFQIAPLLNRILSGATAENIKMKMRMEWFVVKSNFLSTQMGKLPRTISYTRYHYFNKVVAAGVTELEHEVVPRFANLKCIILAQQLNSTTSGTAADRYSASFTQNALTKAQVYINGDPLYNNDLDLAHYITWIELMERGFGRDVKKALGAHFDFTQTSNTNKAFLVLPLSLDTKNNSGINTKTGRKTLTIKYQMNVAAQTNFQYFCLYEEVAIINPITKEFKVLS